MSNIKTYPVISIDAWAAPGGGWDWNCWYSRGTVDIDIDGKDKEIIGAMVAAGHMAPGAEKLVYIDDDGINLVLCDNQTDEPYYAIQYDGLEP